MTSVPQGAESSPSGGRRIVLVHGATSGPWCFDGWAEQFPDDDVLAPDLQQGLDVAHATMAQYADPVVAAAGDGRAVLCGWSMGGLVAMMAALRCRPAALVVLEPSVPQEVDGGDPDWPVEPGTYEAESVYGESVARLRHRLESLPARGDRKRGISVPGFACPVLVVAGDDYVDTRGRPVADHYGAELLEFAGLDHVQLVTDPRVRAAIAGWVQSVAPR